MLKFSQKEVILLRNNGSEPEYNAKKWNSANSVVQKANCYAYFLQDYRSLKSDPKDIFPQPGAFADRLKRRRISNGISSPSLHAISDERQKNGVLRVSAPYSCATLVKAVLADNAGSVFPVDRLAVCPKNYYKGFAAVDSQPDGDFHFWIQHNNGLWSHKPGELDATDRDADGATILDPLISNRGRYRDACAYFCIPNNTYKPTFAAADA